MRLNPSDLDTLLALQLTIAWAGEGAGDRLGWWRSDLVDGEGGGDLFARLVPRTAAWASLILVREVLSRVSSPVEACVLLAAALVPLDKRYPMPFLEISK